MKLKISTHHFLNQIPTNPGVYRFYSAEDELLYVGKANNLKNRVKSYFANSNTITSPRIALMIKKIDYIELTVTENEVSALLLENNLIKNLKPKYNIVFRDDKTYPLIRLSKHKFPRIDSYRGKTNNNNLFFGPYPNSKAVKQAIDMIQRIFKLRTCTDTFFNNRSRPCMLYQIKRCTAPCVKLIDEIEYKKTVDLATSFLSGNYASIIDNLTTQMYIAADSTEFEIAAHIRDTINLIKQIATSQIINNHNKPISADIIIHEVHNDKVFIYLIILRNGMYVGDKHFIINNPDYINKDYINIILEAFLENYYIEPRNTKLIYTTHNFSNAFNQLILQAFEIKILTKITGQLINLYQMGTNNLKQIIMNNDGDGFGSSKILLKSAQILANYLHTETKLKTENKINRIECLDVSHNHGDNAVASIVVYENGKIDHNQYRHYNLSKEVNGNDILAMELILKRRIASYIAQPLPDVFLIDGGKTQYNIAKNIIKQYIDSLDADNQKNRTTPQVVSIFKGKRRDPKLDSVIINENKTIMAIDEPELFQLLQKLRDEAHRFAITHHRKQGQKKMQHSLLDEIPNLGPIKKRALIAYFGSGKLVAKATISELQNIRGVGLQLATQIYTYFNGNNN